MMIKRMNGVDLSGFLFTETWIFDLDNTLYRGDNGFFSQIDKKMNEFIVSALDVTLEDAAQMRHEYYVSYGSTLSGLMSNHGVEPERFLEYVHDIDLSPIAAAPELAQALTALPGRRFIFTNGSRRHAERVVEKLGVSGCFDDVFDIAAAGFTPKPAREAYDRFLRRLDVQPRAAAMFEDLPHNLENPHDLGMQTVLVTSGACVHPSQSAIGQWTNRPAHIHHVTDDLTTFLAGVLSRIGADGDTSPADQNGGAPIDNSAAAAPQKFGNGSRTDAGSS